MENEETDTESRAPTAISGVSWDLIGISQSKQSGASNAGYQQHKQQQQQRQTTVLVPRKSFTAYRLQYATPEQIARDSKLLFIGPLPEKWLGGWKLRLSPDKWLQKVLDSTQYATEYPFKQQLATTYATIDKLGRKVKKGARFQKINALSGGNRSQGDDVSSQGNQDQQQRPKRSYAKIKFGATPAEKNSQSEYKNTGIPPFEDPRISENRKRLKKEQKQARRYLAASKFQKANYAKIMENRRTSGRRAVKKKKFVARQLMPEPIELPNDLEEANYNDRTKPKKNVLKNPSKVVMKMKDKTVSKARNIKDNLNNERIGLTTKVLGRFKVGELVKVQRMLVQVKLLPRIKIVNEHFCDSTPYESRTLERWKEYFVAVRSTGDVELPLLIQFYTQRGIKKFEELESRLKEERTRNKLLDFVLDAKSCFVSFYNVLDKSVAISVPSAEEGEGARVYIFKANSQIASTNWYLFIRCSIGFSCGEYMRVNIPDLSLEIDIRVSADAYEEIIQDDKDEPYLKLSYRENGYYVKNITSVSFIIKLVISRLKIVADDFPEILSWLQKIQDNKYKLGLAWRHYDRLEWIGEHHQNILWQYHASRKNFSLELRIMDHYPTIAVTYNGSFLQEPCAVEGFLKRLTNNTGKWISSFRTKSVSKFYQYFFTNKELLFFGYFKSGLPPIKSMYCTDPRSTQSRYENHINTATDLPNTIELCNFSLDENNHVEWLKPGTSTTEFNYHDAVEFLEVRRKSHNLLNSRGIINMCDIATVSSYNDAVTGRRRKTKFPDRNFVITLRNSSRIILEAGNENAKNEWVSSLNALARYWKLRKAEDISRMKFVKEANLAKLTISEYAEALFVEKASKWDLQKGISDSKIFNVNSLSLLKTIIYSGELYHKPHKHANFEKYYVVLVPGYLLLYKMFSRYFFSNVVTPTANYQHFLSIPLNNCYLYSGKLTSSDLLLRDRNFDPVNPGHHALPKVYLDGWKSCEDEPSRCFTVWIGTKKLIAKSRKKKNTKGLQQIEKISNEQGEQEPVDTSRFGQQNKFVEKVNRLGIEGRTLVFMARSRQEKDLWATNILYEIGRFSYGANSDEIRIL